MTQRTYASVMYGAFLTKKLFLLLLLLLVRDYVCVAFAPFLVQQSVSRTTTYGKQNSFGTIPSHSVWMIAATRSSGIRSTNENIVETIPTASSNNEDGTDDIASRSLAATLLEDSSGHINRELATRIWNWEQDYRKQINLPKINYSIRSGLRLVETLVKEIVTSQSYYGISNEYERSSLESDLVQEGLSALLDAMSHYRNDDAFYRNLTDQDEAMLGDGTNHSLSFELYAKEQIYLQLLDAVDINDVSHPIRLPKSIKLVLDDMKMIITSFVKSNGHKPSMNEIAMELGISNKKLHDYIKLVRQNRRLVSVERTVEIYNPHENNDHVRKQYADQDEWEVRHGLVLDNGKRIDKDKLIDEFIDETIQNEGDDEWRHDEQVVGPLQDTIPDSETATTRSWLRSSNDRAVDVYLQDDNDDDIYMSVDDVALQELIRNDLSDFLTSVLNEQELHVVQVAFGLETSSSTTDVKMGQTIGSIKTSPQSSMALTDIATKCNLSFEQVIHLLRASISKLRKSYREKNMIKSEYDVLP